ncbi:MAG: DNA polymerase III subunit delta [Patescibacteria group bacterium]
MLFFISGTDHFRAQQKLKELTLQFIQKRDKNGLNVIRLDGEALDFENFKQEALTVPFLGEKKLIIVKNVLKTKKRWEPIFEFLKSRGETLENNFVFIELLTNEKKARPAGTFFSYLKKQKYSWEFNLLKENQLKKWLDGYLADKKIKTDKEALEELIISVGNDLGHLTLEIEKLAAYKDGDLIKKEDVQLLVKAKFDENIFNLVDAMGEKNKRRALKLASDQINGGNHPLSILSMVNRQFKILIKIKERQERNERLNNLELASALGLHPFVVQKASRQAKNFTFDRLLKAQNELIQMESLLKFGAKNPELLFDLFIVKYC